jgi:phosphatidylinositol glycan class U
MHQKVAAFIFTMAATTTAATAASLPLPPNNNNNDDDNNNNNNNNSEDKDDDAAVPTSAQPPPVPHWTRSNSRAFCIALTLRLLLCGSGYVYGRGWIPLPVVSRAALRSLLVHRTWTWEHVREVSCSQHWGAGGDNRDNNNNGASSHVDPIRGAALPPLWILFWECFMNLPHANLLVALLLTAVDYGVASLWYRIGIGRQASRTTTKEQDCVVARLMPPRIAPPAHLLRLLPDERQLPPLLALLYFANPVSILASAVYGGLANIKLALLLLAVVGVSSSQNGDDGNDQGRWSKKMAMACVALGTLVYLDVSYGVFIIALPVPWDATLLSFALWQLASQALAPSWTLWYILPSALSADIPPSLSILWYTHMEFFTRFAPLLRLLLGGLPYLVVIPLAIRLHSYPMVLVREHKTTVHPTSLFGRSRSHGTHTHAGCFLFYSISVQVAVYWLILHTLCQPVSTLYDLLVGLLLLLLSPHSIARMKPVLSLFCLCGLGVPVALYPGLHDMWLVSGNGEANFVFFQCLAYQILLANLLLQFVTASLQRDKAWRLTEKEASI